MQKNKNEKFIIFCLRIWKHNLLTQFIFERYTRCLGKSYHCLNGHIMPTNQAMRKSYGLFSRRWKRKSSVQTWRMFHTSFQRVAMFGRLVGWMESWKFYSWKWTTFYYRVFLNLHTKRRVKTNDALMIVQQLSMSNNWAFTLFFNQKTFLVYESHLNSKTESRNTPRSDKCSRIHIKLSGRMYEWWRARE